MEFQATDMVSSASVDPASRVVERVNVGGYFPRSDKRRFHTNINLVLPTLGFTVNNPIIWQHR